MFKYYRSNGQYTISNVGTNGVVDSIDNMTLLGDDAGMISFLVRGDFTVLNSFTRVVGGPNGFEDGILWSTFDFFIQITLAGSTASGQFLPISNDETVLFTLDPGLTADNFRRFENEPIYLETGINFAAGMQGATLFSVGDPIETGAFVVVEPGDFDGDSSFSCSDIDALVAEIASGENDAAFDLTGDGVVNLDDRDWWLENAGIANLVSGESYTSGDANLDGAVDMLDFGVWNDHRFNNDAGWCSGDFNADGFVDVSDFNVWNSSRSTSTDLANVPEPDVRVLLLWLFAGMLRLRHSRGSLRDPSFTEVASVLIFNVH